MTLIASCDWGFRTADKQDRIAVRIGSASLGIDDLDAEVRRVRREGPSVVAIASLTASGRRDIASRLTDEMIFAEAARRAGMSELADIKADVESCERRLLADRFATRVLARTELDETALRRHFDAHRDRFLSQEERYVRHVVVATEAEAVAARSRIDAGESMARVASSVNTDATRLHRGAIGWIRRGLMEPTFEQAVFALRDGELSAPVHSSFGWHVIVVEKRRGGEEASFEQSRERVASDLRKHILATAREDALADGSVTTEPALEEWISAAAAENRR